RARERHSALGCQGLMGGITTGPYRGPLSHRRPRRSTGTGGGRLDATRGRVLYESARYSVLTEHVILGMAVIGVLGLLMDLAMRALERRLTPWHAGAMATR